MSAFSLKMIALVFMFLDHVAEFIPGTPIVFRWMGRISAPVFIYCCVWSFECTSSKIGYMKRLYFAGVLMSIVQYFLRHMACACIDLEPVIVQRIRCTAGVDLDAPFV